MSDLHYLDAIPALSRAISKAVKELGRLAKLDPRLQSKVLEATLVSLLMHNFNQGRATKRSFIKIVEELRKLPSFSEVAELDLILTILLFVYDKELLKHSKKLIGKTWETIERDAINQRFKEGRYEPKEREQFRGVSLALFFEYPEGLRLSLGSYLTPLKNIVRETAQPHFTIFNLGTEIPLAAVKPLCESVKEEIEYELRRDFHLHQLWKRLRQATVRDEVFIIPDGSLVLFGAGEFLKLMHEVRLKLRERVLPQNLESTLARDAQPVWTHTVFARVVDIVSPIQVQEMQEKAMQNRGEKIELAEVKLGLMIFNDLKAMLPVEIIEINP